MREALLNTGYVHRMRVYLREMYPVSIRLAGAVLLYGAVSLSLRRIYGFGPNLLSKWSLIGVTSVFVFLLILRLMDELKDRQIDERLFRHRPIPSGRVLPSDIRFTLVLACTVFISANAFAQSAAWTAALALAYAFLMFRFFFVPEAMRRSLPLALVSHNPIVPILTAHLVSLFLAGSGCALADIKWAPAVLLVAMIWAAGFAWEIARKIRAPEEEDEYVTYSQLVGPVGAVVLAGSAQTLAFLAGFILFLTTELSALLPVAAGFGLVSTLAGHARFLARPTPATSKLGAPAERYMIVTLLALIVGSLDTTM